MTIKFKQPFSGVEMLLADYERKAFRAEETVAGQSIDASDGSVDFSFFNVCFCR